MDVEIDRYNMVEQQIRPWEVLDQRVLDLILHTPRERFVPPGYESLAFVDTEIPLGHGQTMMPPREEGRLVQSLDLSASDDVLEIGTGSGYVTTLLAGLAHHVTSVEIIPELHERAKGALAANEINNVTLLQADGLRGHADAGPYDAIAVTGSVPTVDDALLKQLKPNGRLFIVVGEPPVMSARLITRMGVSEWSEENIFETLLTPLIGASAPERFEL
jgi:protein-L-isoaspartate(D-aspartate) O-methyltransferase